MKDVRADFPLLSGRRVSYLDSAATSQKPRQVLEAMRRFYEESNANVHRGVYALAEEASEALEGARREVAGFIGAPDPASVVFTRGTTESINLVAQGWAARRLPLMRRLGVAGTVRASVQVYSTRTEVDALVTAVDAARGALA